MEEKYVLSFQRILYFYTIFIFDIRDNSSQIASSSKSSWDFIFVFIIFGFLGVLISDFQCNSFTFFGFVGGFSFVSQCNSFTFVSSFAFIAQFSIRNPSSSQKSSLHSGFNKQLCCFFRKWGNSSTGNSACDFVFGCPI